MEALVLPAMLVLVVVFSAVAWLSVVRSEKAYRDSSGRKEEQLPDAGHEYLRKRRRR